MNIISLQSCATPSQTQRQLRPATVNEQTLVIRNFSEHHLHGNPNGSMILSVIKDAVSIENIQR
jgi:hypothetical protein